MSRGRLLVRVAATVVLLVAAGAVGAGRYYAGEILDVEAPSPPSYDTRIVAVAPGSVTLEATEQSERVGTVRRQYRALVGRPSVGVRADVDGYAYPDDPADAGFDFPVREVQIAGPLGTYPAWHAQPPAGATGMVWAVFVHGRAARRSECFRMLPTLVHLGMDTLCVTYRNDPGAPRDPDGIYRQGAQEWTDVAAAIRYARAHGARRIVLAGASMGAQIGADYLRFAAEPDIEAVVWDAPLLDWGPVIGDAARDRGIPSFLVPLGMLASEVRAGINYGELNQIANAEDFDVPILIVHGTADRTVPVYVSDRFAAARRDLVTYLRVDGVDHVAAWNRDPAAYDRALRSFLAAKL